MTGVQTCALPISLGKTVLLTTHYLDEAEQLADRVAVMRDGVIVKIGRPRELTTAGLEVEIRYRRDSEEIVIRTSEPTRVLHQLTSEALARGEERLRRRHPVDLPAVDGAEQHEQEQREQEDEERRLLAPPERELLRAQLVHEDPHSASASPSSSER